MGGDPFGLYPRGHGRHKSASEPYATTDLCVPRLHGEHPVPLVNPYSPLSHWQAACVLFPYLVARTVLLGHPVHDSVAWLYQSHAALHAHTVLSAVQAVQAELDVDPEGA